MLTSSQLAIAISAVLAGAVILGWILHWLWTRAANHPTDDRERLVEMVNRLHNSDQARDEAFEARERAENLLASREAEMRARMEAMQHRLDGAVEGREAELSQGLREAQADAEAAMTGLGVARRRIAELEQSIEDRAAEISETYKTQITELEAARTASKKARDGLSAALDERSQELADAQEKIAALEAGGTEEAMTPPAKTTRRRPARKKATGGRAKKT